MKLTTLKYFKHVTNSWRLRLSHVTSADNDVIKTLIHVYAPRLTEESCFMAEIGQSSALRVFVRLITVFVLTLCAEMLRYKS